VSILQLKIEFLSMTWCRCEHYNQTRNKDHLLIYAIGDGSYDIDYIEAQFNDDRDELVRIETNARQLGTGPQVVCTTVANFGMQRAYCRVFYSILDCNDLHVTNILFIISN
jgi:hypothetical protein